MADERFRTSPLSTPDSRFDGTVVPADDPVDDVPDTVGAPRGMVDLRWLRNAYDWEE